MTEHAPGTPADVDLHRRSDGCVVIGSPLAAAAGVGLVPTLGGLFTVDPVDPGAVSVLVPAAPDDECLHALSALLGDDVATSASRVAREGGSVAAVRVADLAAREDVSRLGVLQWVTTHSAVGLAQPLLTVEQLSYAARLAPVMDPDWPGERDLVAWTDTILEWARRARADHSPWPRHRAIQDLLQDALGILGEVLPLADPRLAQLGHERELLTAMHELGLSHVDASAHPDWLTELRPQAAATYGGTDGVALDGLGAVEWSRVPPGLTSRAENAVSWRIRRHDGAHVLTVLVKAPATTPDLALLVTPSMPMPPMKIINASVYQGNWPLPVMVAGLEFRAEAQSWLGSQHVAPAVLERLSNPREGEIEVDIHEAGAAPPRRGRALRQRAAGQRWAARGATAMRLAALTTGETHLGWRDTASQAWSRAASVYAGLPAEVGAAPRAQCRAALATLGDGGDRPRLTWRDRHTAPVESPARVDQASPVSAAEAWFALAHAHD